MAFSKIRSRSGFALSAGIIAAAGVTGFALGGAFADDDTAPPYETNASGQTLGTFDDIPDGVWSDEYPDLVQVRATNGQIGYVESDLLNELTGGNVSSPEEALAWQEQQRQADWTRQDIPVYAEDGTTQIGVFPVTNSHRVFEELSPEEQELYEQVESDLRDRADELRSGD